MSDDRFESVLGRLGGGPRPLPDGADDRIWARIEEAGHRPADQVTTTADPAEPPVVVDFAEDDGGPASGHRRWVRAAAAGVAAAAAVVVAVLLWPGDDQQTEIDPRGGTGVAPAIDVIAYLSPPDPVEDSGSRLVLVQADGTGRVELDEPWIWSPGWAADGRSLVFGCATPEEITDWNPSVVCAVNADGTGFARLTAIPGPDDPTGWSPDRIDLDVQPTISPDGTHIAFTSWRDAPGADDGAPDIFVMDADGTNLTNLTQNPAGDGAPVWSPAGGRIAFVSERGGAGFELYVMDADGGSVTGLGPWTGSVAWSPDGTRIVAAGGDSGQNSPVVVVTVDTGAVRTLVDQGSDMAWSPDGTRIAYVDDTARLVVSDVTGGDPVVVADDGSLEMRPTWSPDGTRLAYASVEGIAVVGADGTGRTLIVAEPGASEPRWSPVGDS